MVDDGSTDDTRDVIRPYGSRLKYHYQDNQGVAIARTVAIGLARGNYISFLDADDIWEPNNLQVKYEGLQRFPGIGGVFSDFSIFDQAGERCRFGTKRQFPFFRRTRLDYVDIFPERHHVKSGQLNLDVYVGNIFESLFRGNFVLSTSMVFNRALAKEVGGMRPDLRTNEDYEYWLRFANRHRLAFIDYPLVRYRRHAEQLTDPRHIEGIVLAVMDIIDGYEEEFRRRGRSEVFARRKAELRCTLAKVRHRQGRGPEARELIGQALSWHMRLWEAYGLYALSFVPFELLTRIRSWRGGN